MSEEKGYEKLCMNKDCGHIWSEPTKVCPKCDGVRWEIRTLRVREGERNE